MDNQALIILAEMLDKARYQANSIETTAPEYGVYGKIKYALIDTLALITKDYSTALDVYQSILDGNTVRQALEAEGFS